MRSKCLLVANIWTTLYSGALFWIFIGQMIIEYKTDFFEYHKILYNLLLYSLDLGFGAEHIIYIGLILYYINIALFLLGAIFGWIGFIAKKSGLALFSAILYLLGTLCFPLCLLTGVPAIIMGFVGYSNQKELNRCNNIQ